MKSTKRRTAARKGFRLENLETRTMLSNYIVNTTSDSPNPGLGFTSLREAINLANAHAGSDTIEFSSSVFATPKTITLSNGFMAVYGTLAIAGPGSAKLTINAHSASRMFDIEDGAVATISGMTFENGAAPYLQQTVEAGGAILNYGSSLTVNACVFNNNVVNTTPAPTTQDGAGGAIYSPGNLIVAHSTFTGNSVNSNEAGTYADGGAIWCTGALTISSSTFSSNKAAASGDPYDGNGGQAAGGAIYATGKLSISSSTLSSNSATGGQGTNGGSAYGGAIYSSNTDLIVSSTITGNSANGANPVGYGNNGGGFGGGVYATSAVSVSSSKITDNTADSGYNTYAGAGPFEQLSAAGGGIFCKSSLTLFQSTVSGNAADGGMGFYSNIPGAGAQGGGIFVKGNLTITYSSIFSNKAIGGIGNAANTAPNIPSGPGGVAQGGGIWAGGSATLINSTVANNIAQGGHGGDANIDGAPSGTGAGTGGDGYGGGIFSSAALTLRDCTVAGNAADAGTGGAGYAGGGPPAVAPGKPGKAYGGGIYSYLDSALLTNTIVSTDRTGSVFNDVGGKLLSSSSGYNLIGVGGGLINGVHGNKVGITNPKLSALQNNGGPTLTMFPLAGSPAINAGSNALIPVGDKSDQRGDARIVGNTVDIGAVEV